MLSTKTCKILTVLCLAVCLSSVAYAQKVAAVKGHASSAVGTMVAVYATEVITYGAGAADISAMWPDLDSFDMIWLGFPNNNAGVFDTFTANAEAFQAWLDRGGKFVATTASSNIQQVYELMPGTVATQNQHRSFEAAHVVDPSHPIVTMPNDISDDAYYDAWAWTSGDIYLAYDGYDVIASETNGDPTWIVHKSMPIVLTTIQPTWSGHPHPEMVQNIFEYLVNFVGRENASGPSPEDQLGDTARDSELSWNAGPVAGSHNVYFGTSFDDVNDATAASPVNVSAGQTDTSFDPGRLDFGQTYYWRIDEVNASPDKTVFKGRVWSFTVEPIAYPVTGITAAASSTFGVSGPEKTIDGSGLVDDLHGVDAADMWISAGVPATIEYAFDRAYKLHELWIWNSNQLIEAFVGFGAKDVVIEHSLDGENWTVLDGVGPLAQASGLGGYAANNTIDFGGAVAQHVRLTVNSVQGIAPQASLSEVRFYYIPTLATRPSPASGTTDVSPDVPLAWGRDGREAGSHDVYVGTDSNNLSLAGSISASSFDTLAVDLQLGQTYFWRVDEVNEAMDPSTWTGDIWSFRTVDAIAVDDMESYKDEEFFEIWATWVDGFDDPSNGSLVGGITGTPETEIVNGGSQSLPLTFGEGGAAVSETTRTFDAPMDWTRHGIKSLSLLVFGTTGNSGQLYLKINNTRVDGGPDISQPGWQAWIIDLSTVGGDVQNVTSLTIGVDGANASGTVYIDEIRLYPKAAEWVTPTAPDSANLLAHYTFDGDVTDSSGNGHHGEANGDPVYGDGIDGQALQFDGVDDYVNVVLDIPENGSATSFWFKTTNPDCGLYAVVQNPLGDGGHDRHIFLVNGNVRIRLWNTEILTARGLDVADGQWHHVVHTYGDAIGGQKVYVDGLLLASGTKAQSDFDWQERVHFGFSNDAASDYLEGMLDDARIYDRAVTQAEAAWLAGKADPVVVPF